MELDFNEHGDIIIALKEAQEAETDQREASREAHHFVDKRDGQWEPDVIQRMKGRPRYTFDKCNPIIDQITGEIEQADFTIKVRPASGEASEDTADVLSGLIRNICNISNAEHIFNQGARNVVTGGFDAWEVVQDYAEADSFDQDLFIRKIPNAIDRVWFDPGSEMQDRSDAKWAIVLQVLTRRDYEKKFPEGKGQSVGDDRSTTTYWNKPDFITVGRFLYKKPRSIELIQMSDGSVYRDDEKYQKVKDELEAAGITEKDRRTRKGWRVYSRLFDGSGWLIEEEETVFDYVPVIPIYGNFKITENKILYRGIVEKLMDPQRVLNYAESRKIEEGALAPRAKWWMTREQAEKDIGTLSTMNTNANPVQTYTHVDGQPAPYFAGGAQINPGLQETALSASEALNQAAGLFSANMGDNPGLQSGTAIEKQIDRGNTSTIKWYSAMEVAQCHTAKVLINAIPRVYDATRQIRILGEDGTPDNVTINTQVIDNQTGELVELHDLSVGEYDVVCEMGPAFKNRQQETAQAFLEMAGINPELTMRGMDIWLKNLSAPGMDLMAERFRQSLLEQGVIPFDQMTEEEQQAAQAAAQQPPQPDPAMLLAQAEMAKAQAEQANAQIKQMETQSKQQVEIAKIQLEQQKLELEAAKFQRMQDDKFNVEAAKVQQTQANIDQNQQKIDLQAQQQQFSEMLELMRAQQQEINDAVNNLKVLREAMGVDAVVGPENTKAYSDQARIVDDKQEG